MRVIHGLAPPPALAFELPFLLAGIYTPEQAGWILSSHHSCISLFPLQMFITAELNIAAKKMLVVFLISCAIFPTSFLRVKKIYIYIKKKETGLHKTGLKTNTHEVSFLYT